MSRFGASAWGIAALASVSAWLLARAAHLRSDPSVRRRVGALTGTPTPPEALLARALGTLASTPMVVRLGTRLAQRPLLIRRLARGGGRWTPADVAARKVLCSLAGGSVATLVAVAAPPTIAVIPLALLLGARLPDLALARRSRSRQARMERQVPELAELLVAATEAGLPPGSAFVRSASSLAPPLGDELRSAVDHVNLGMPWRDALEEVVQRCDVPSLAGITRALARSQRLGGSVAVSLRAIVQDLRGERQARAEELARRAPVKMLFPLVLLILPAFLLLTVGPVLLSTIRSLH